ncbi:MAG: phosphoglucosamine mutase, partial [Planctomycetes bacterium]|nr:phosphoglucosamine mutase [Planctomycetota bacterium]
MKRFFGTDGIRGRANEAPLDPVTLIEIGAVLGRLMRERGGIDGGILIGHDGRRSAAMIFGALSAGLCAEGVEVFDGGLLTTPALAHETRLGNYKAGIIISASHNPAHDNGIKIFGENGQKISDSIEHAIEEQLATAVDAVRGRPGIVHRIERSTGGEAHEYRRFLKKTFHDVDLRGMRVLVDCAHGGGSSIAPTILREFGATV